MSAPVNERINRHSNPSPGRLWKSPPRRDTQQQQQSLQAMIIKWTTEEEEEGREPGPSGRTGSPQPIVYSHYSRHRLASYRWVFQSSSVLHAEESEGLSVTELSERLSTIKAHQSMLPPPLEDTLLSSRSLTSEPSIPPAATKP
eukprot:superscaffoldBa00004896_g19614